MGFRLGSGWVQVLPCGVQVWFRLGSGLALWGSVDDGEMMVMMIVMMIVMVMVMVTMMMMVMMMTRARG